MGRDIPVECEHGVIIDWGDFGGSSIYTGAMCPLCSANRDRRVRAQERGEEAVALLAEGLPQVSAWVGGCMAPVRSAHGDDGTTYIVTGLPCGSCWVCRARAFLAKEET